VHIIFLISSALIVRRTGFLAVHRQPFFRLRGSLLWYDQAKAMVTKLTKHGDSLALVIDQPVLEQLKIGEDTSLDVTMEGNRLVIAPTTTGSSAPANASADRKDFVEAMDWAEQHYGGTFKRLAEHDRKHDV
jgi:antitoxin component of MazEF toxin-antitoxin module